MQMTMAELTIVEKGKKLIKFFPVREAQIPQLKNAAENIELLAF